MLELIHQHIIGRLQRITTDGNPLKVFPYDASRDKGESEYPSADVIFLYVAPDHKSERPCHEIFIPSDEQGSVEYTPIQAMGGGSTVTGPVRYTVKPFPTPVKAVFEVTLDATVVSHIHALRERIFQAFPPGYQPNIGGYYPIFTLDKPTNHDELEKPLFRTTFLLHVSDVYLDRLESYQVSAILDPQIQTEWQARD